MYLFLICFYLNKRFDPHLDTDSGDVGVEIADPVLGGGSGKRRGVVIPADGAYDPKQYNDLKVPPELDNVFQYIMK